MADIAIDELCAYLDDYLSIAEIPDFGGAMNGLQVEGPGTIGKIAAAVDACEATIEGAAACGADLLLVHHGLFWGAPFPLTGRAFRRISKLIEGSIAVYSAHLPLDVHAEVGNNALLAQLLGVDVTSSFAEYKGVSLALSGEWSGSRDEMISRIEASLGCTPQVIACGPESIARVGILTGSGGSTVAEAAAAGVDTFVTGEGTHPSYFDAEENGLNLVLAGHYATETLGVKALGRHLAERFDLEYEFLDHPTGL